MNTLPPDLTNTNISFNISKENAPYLRFMYEQERKDVNETLDQYVKRITRKAALKYWANNEVQLTQESIAVTREQIRTEAETFANS